MNYITGNCQILPYTCLRPVSSLILFKLLNLLTNFNELKKLLSSLTGVYPTISSDKIHYSSHREKVVSPITTLQFKVISNILISVQQRSGLVGAFSRGQNKQSLEITC